MKKSIQLKEERMKLVQDNRVLLNKADADRRRLTADEQTEYDKRDKDIENLDAEILRHEKQEAREAAAAQREPNRVPDVPQSNGGEPQNIRATAEYRKAFAAMMAGRRPAVAPEIMNALQADVDTAGGFLQAPVQFVQELIKSIDDSVFLRDLATKYTVTNAEALGSPSLDADPADSDWTAELLTGSEDSTMKFGRRELRPHPLAKRIKISAKLIRSNVMSAESLVQKRLGYKFGITQEKAFLSGTGAQQPLGVFTPSNDGIPTSRDVSTGNSATAIAADNLFECLYSLKEGYQRNATWLFHRDAIKQIRKLKDSQNQYLWQPGLQAGQPNMILDRPYKMSEYVPNTFTTGLYVGIIGDFSYYWIADALSMQVQRLNELYAETNQVGYIGRLETDGMPVLGEAFARVKLA